jgi:hypothetical protein
MRSAAASIALLLLCAVHAHAQGGQATEPRITGRVLIRGTTTGVGEATILVEGTGLVARSDSLGRYTLSRVPSGPQVLLVRRLGFAPSRTPVTVPATGAITLDLIVATSALQLERPVVTADQAGRARGELGTASVIDRDAIANQVASSLQGVLELVPGVPLQPPGLDAAAQFSLRALGATTGGIGFGGSSAADIGAAGTLIVLDGVPLSNNANLQTVGSRGEIVSPASTAGGGIDLRRIPAATLERVEVIRGIPSVRWGDLTQGAIIVDTRAAATAPELAARFDPRTREANIVGGRSYRDEHQSLTATFNLAETRQMQTLSSASTLRGAGQVAHRLQLGVAPGDRRGPDGRSPLARYTFDTRADWWQLRYDSPERADVDPGRNSFTNDRGLRLGERARLALGNAIVEWTGAFDAQAQHTRETQTRIRPAMPFTDRLTEGRTIGQFIDGVYLGEYELKGAPRLLYSRLEWDRSPPRSNARWTVSQMRVGSELRREWNNGEGYLFDMSRPPQSSSFNGTRGFDRPRRFEGTPPLVTSALYTDVRGTARFGQAVVEVQPGVRLDVLHEGDWWASGARSSMVQPRITAQLAPRPWVRLRGGAGVVSKMPTVAQLFPALQYYDLVNVNRYTIEPAERLAVLTTFIRDPANPDLGYSRSVKREAGLELDGGSKYGALSVTFFDDALSRAVTVRRDAGVLLRDRYALEDTGPGRPGRVVDPPLFSEFVPIFIDRNVNGGNLGGRGMEFNASFPVIPMLRTRLEVSGATIRSSFRTSDLDFGNVARLQEFQVDTLVKRIAIFEGARNQTRRSILTWRLVHHQPDLGLVITGVVQQRLGDERRVLGRTDSLSFVGYIVRTGEIVLVPEEERTRAEYADLRLARAATTRLVRREPDDWVMSLQVAKSIGANGRLSFYIFNALDKLATFGSGTVRALPSSRFGAELTIPTAMFLGGAR